MAFVLSNRWRRGGLTLDNLMELILQTGTLQHGHFVLSSGRHSDEYWEKFRLLEWPRITQQLCCALAESYHEQRIAAVVGPTTGGALLAQEVARQLDTRCLLAEPVTSGGRELRRGFELGEHERVLIVDDVLTTGLSLRETLSAIAPYRPEIIGIEVLIDRSGGEAMRQFCVPCHALLTVSAPTYAPAECPLCAQNIPIVKPGTRGQGNHDLPGWV
jgi:orotate phosphoribosyltransferase